MVTRSGIGVPPERYRSEVPGRSGNTMTKMHLVHKNRMRCLKHLRGTRGSQLLEFAFALPFLAALAVGVTDFGQAYNLKHILTNAAREAARITVSNPLSNTNCADPTGYTNSCTVQAAADAAKQYLLNAGLSPASCITPDSPTSSGTLTWTHSCSGITLTIDRGYVFTATSGNVVPSTQVTLSYPYTWTFGRLIGLLVKGSTTSLPTTLTTSLIMQNLVP